MIYSRLIPPVALAASLIGGCAASPHAHDTAAVINARTQAAALNPDTAKAATAAAVQQVIVTEQAFAKTMADRDFKAFVTFLSPDAVFFSGASVKHGPAEVAVQWQPYYEGRKAPFSWAPDHVEVLASGKLALSTGPVYVDGKIVGRFNSIWRLEADNSWRIVFDKGEAVCGAKL
ncbi:MAG TPA: nuclear transport factor 2 family protein [Steroidobacteraceae bacterium]